MSKLKLWWMGLICLGQIYTEYKDIPKLLEQMIKLEDILTGRVPATPVQTPYIQNLLSETPDLQIHKQYETAERVKILDEAVNVLSTRYKVVEGRPAIGGTEIRKKGAALQEIEAQVRQLTLERTSLASTTFTVSN